MSEERKAVPLFGHMVLMTRAEADTWNAFNKQLKEQGKRLGAFPVEEGLKQLTTAFAAQGFRIAVLEDRSGEVKY